MFEWGGPSSQAGVGAGWARGGTGIEEQLESFPRTAKSLLSPNLCSSEGPGNM